MNTLDIAGLVELKKEELIRDKPIEIQRLEVALQSIAKRIEYCKYHYDEFITNTDAKELFIDRLDASSSVNISIRTVYEANALAFLQNLHAIIDSLPYALNIIFRVIDDIENKNVGWYEDFVKKYEKYDFSGDLRSLFSDETFLKIKGFVNRTKHKHLIRIKNNYSNLVFEDFSYIHKGDVKVVKEQEVRSFIVDCHDNLMPKFISLCNAVKSSKAKEVYGV